MKCNTRVFRFLLILLFYVSSNSFNQALPQYRTVLDGAWEWRDSIGQHVLIFEDNYFTNTVYDTSNKQFVLSRGGRFEVQNNQLSTKIEFDSQHIDSVGKDMAYTFFLDTNKVIFQMDSITVIGNRIDDGTGALAGRWRITGRMEDGKMTTIDSAARKTIKILSGARFQWVAMNTDTREFFGTGGGTYTFVDGKYTENIEFFSSDSTRVGVSLSFDGVVEGGQWHHSGISSKGESVHEIWRRTR